MAIFEKTIRNQNFDTLLRKLEHAIPDSSWSAELEAGSDFKEGSARCSVRVFERYSVVGVPYIMDNAAAPLRAKYQNHTPRPEDVLAQLLAQQP